MTSTIYVYKKQVIEGRTSYIENKYTVDVTAITPVYVKDGNLVITTTKGEVKIDQESIPIVTPETLEEDYGLVLDIPNVSRESDGILDKDSYRLFDSTGMQIRVQV